MRFDMEHLVKGIVLVLASASKQVIDYETKKYKPFGFRYWLGVIALCYLSIIYSLLLFIVCALLYTVLTHFSWGLLGVWLLLFLLLIFASVRIYPYYKIMIERTRFYKNQIKQ